MHVRQQIIHFQCNYQLKTVRLTTINVRGVTIHRKYGSPRYEAGSSVHGLFLVISVWFTQKNFFERQN